MPMAGELSYKVRHTSTPIYLNNLLSERAINSTVSLRSLSRPLLYILRIRTVCGARAFSIGAPTIWNSIPATLQLSNSVACFKS